jgi:calpain-15
MLAAWDKQGFLITGGTPGQSMWQETDDRPDGSGLVPGHAYSIIQVVEAKGNKLLNLRNPWGNFEWDGNWSDSSFLWTEEMKQLVKPSLDGEDGSFWMGFDDFMFKFDTIGLSRVTNWDELRLRGKFIRYSDVKEPENEIVVSKWYYALEVPEKSHVVIGIHQEDER